MVDNCPIKHGSSSQSIKDTKISDKRWPKKHWSSLSQNYSKSKYFKEYRDIFEQCYFGINSEYLSEINRMFIEKINGIPGD